MSQFIKHELSEVSLYAFCLVLICEQMCLYQYDIVHESFVSRRFNNNFLLTLSKVPFLVRSVPVFAFWYWIRCAGIGATGDFSFKIPK